MPPEIAALLGAGIAGATSIITSLLTSRHEITKERRAEALRGIGEIHRALAEDKRLYRSVVESVVVVLGTRKVPPSKLRTVEESDRIEFNITMYAPTLLEVYSELSDDGTKLVTKYAEFLSGLARGEASLDVGNELASMCGHLVERTSKLQRALGILARKQYGVSLGDWIKLSLEDVFL